MLLWRGHTFFQNFLLFAVTSLQLLRLKSKCLGPTQLGCVSSEIYHFNGIPLMNFKLTAPIYWCVSYICNNNNTTLHHFLSISLDEKWSIYSCKSA